MTTQHNSDVELDRRLAATQAELLEALDRRLDLHEGLAAILGDEAAYDAEEDAREMRRHGQYCDDGRWCPHTDTLHETDDPTTRGRP